MDLPVPVAVCRKSIWEYTANDALRELWPYIEHAADCDRGCFGMDRACNCGLTKLLEKYGVKA